MKNSRGFTVIELLVAAIVLALAGVLIFAQKRELEVAHQDDQRKITINAMHYSLEEAYYKEHQHYPPSIDESVLLTVDPDLFIDPNGDKLGEPGADYRYEATGCIDGECRGYRLSATLENEADYIKTNRDSSQ